MAHSPDPHTHTKKLPEEPKGHNDNGDLSVKKQENVQILIEFNHSSFLEHFLYAENLF